MNLCQQAVGANDGSKFLEASIKLYSEFLENYAKWTVPPKLSNGYQPNVLLVTVAQKSVTNQLVSLLAKATHGSVRSKQTYT